jgi:hypothetical protein
MARAEQTPRPLRGAVLLITASRAASTYDPLMAIEDDTRDRSVDVAAKVERRASDERRPEMKFVLTPDRRRILVVVDDNKRREDKEVTSC